MGRRFALSAAACLTLLAQFTQAGNSWVGGGGDSLWSNPNNWTPAGSPTPGPNVLLNFTNTNGNYASVNDYVGWSNWLWLNFNPGGNFTLTSQPNCNLDLQFAITNDSIYDVSVSFGEIALKGHASVSPARGTLNVASGHIYTNGYTLGVSGDQNKHLNITADVTGSGALKLYYASIVNLHSNNTYTGNTEVDGGTLRIHSSAAISGSSRVYLGSGDVNNANRTANLQLYNTSQTFSNRIIVNKSDTGAGIGSGQRMIWGNQSSGTMTSTGTIELNGNLRAGTSVAANYLELTGNIINGADNSANVARGFEVFGGNVRVSGNNTYTGQTTVNGTLEVRSATAIPYGTGKGNISIAGALDLHGFAVNVNGITGNGPVVNRATSPATITLGNNNVSSSFTGSIIDSVGMVSVIKTGTGSILINGNNTFSGDLTINQGTIATAFIPYGLGKGGVHVNSPGALVVIPGTARMNGLWGNGIVENYNSGATTFWVGYADQSSVFAGTIRNSVGVIQLMKTGNGTLTLGGSNTYSGATSVHAGTLSLGISDAVPSGAGKGNVVVNSVLDLHGFDQTINGLQGTGSIDNFGSGNSLLTIGAADVSSKYEGRIANTTGQLALTKVGAGSISLGAWNAPLSFQGNTNINAGTLVIQTTHSPAGPYTVAAGGALGGTGTISAAVTINPGGTIAPGVVDVGVIRTGDLSVSGTYAADFRLGQNLGDRIEVTGSVNLASATLKFVFVTAPYGSTPQTIVIVRNDGTDPVSGTFASFDAPAWVSYSMNYAYNGDGGSVGNDVAVTFTHVPEPTAAVLLAGGGLLLRRTRIRRS